MEIIVIFECGASPLAKKFVEFHGQGFGLCIRQVGWGATAVKSGGVRYIRRPVAARSSEAKVAETFGDPGLSYETRILGEFRDP